MSTDQTVLSPDDERSSRRARVLRMLTHDDEGGSAVWLTSPAAVSWYLGGARVHTSLVGPPVAGVLVGETIEQVITFSNEVDRLVAEELPEDIQVRTVPWHGRLEDALTGHTGMRTEAELTAPLRAARASLLPGERKRFSRLCAESAEALTRRLQHFDPAQTERQLSAVVAADLIGLGADPVVVMVSGAERLPYRHPLPTDAPVGERAMVVVCARRDGMIANFTRWVSAGELGPQLREAEQRLLQVEAAFFTATRPGATLEEVLSAGAAAYSRHGFDAEEWQNHHQGGAAGYAGRDPRAAPGVTDIVQDGQALAWNPSAPGQKVEDTVLLEDETIIPLSADPAWPTTEVNGIARPLTLEV